MITIFGDSHSNIFRMVNNEAGMDVFRVVTVPGATALGAVRPDSKTNALKEFRKILDDKNQVVSRLVIQLGEVDCGFLSWYLSQVKGGEARDYLAESANSIALFCEEVLCKRPDLQAKDIWLLGVNFSPDIDLNSRKFLHGLRSRVQLTKKDIDGAVEYYNGLLKKIAEDNGYVFFDVSKLFSYDDKVVKPFYMSSDKYDHHLNYRRSWGVLLAFMLGERQESIGSINSSRFHGRSYLFRSLVKKMFFYVFNRNF